MCKHTAKYSPFHGYRLHSDEHICYGCKYTSMFTLHRHIPHLHSTTSNTKQQQESELHCLLYLVEQHEKVKNKQTVHVNRKVWKKLSCTCAATEQWQSHKSTNFWAAYRCRRESVSTLTDLGVHYIVTDRQGS